MTKYNSIEEKKEAIKRQKREYARRRKAKGEGFVNFVSSLITGRKTLSPKVNKILEKYGNEVIVSANIGRSPVQGIITGIIKIVSSTPYDKLFHLFIELKLNSGVKLILEKNAVINMDVNKTISNAEIIQVPNIPNTLTVNELLENTKKAMGDKFLPYESKSNNCQYFIMAVLNSNGLNNPELTKFVKQDTEDIFKNPTFKKFADVITDIGGRADVVLQGGDLQRDNGLLLNHLVSHITDKKEPVDDRDFEHAIMIINDLKKMKKSKMKGGRIYDDSSSSSDNDNDKIKLFKNKKMSSKDMKGKGIESLFRDIGKYVQPVADAAQDRAIKEIKGNGDFFRDAGKYLQPVADAAQDRAIKEIKGSGVKFSKKQLLEIILHKNKVIEDLERHAYGSKGQGIESLFRDIGKYVQPVADAAQDRAIKEIKGSGGKGSGRRKKAAAVPMEAVAPMKMGRPKKGSAEAKAWGQRMAELRRKN